MGYITYVNLAHEVVEFLFSASAIYFSVCVLFRKGMLKKSLTLSPTITVYFGFVFFWSITATTYFAYLIIFWKPEFFYNAYLLYFGGLVPGLFFNTSSIAETFLCIERCLSLLFPLRYKMRHKNAFAILTFFGMLGAIASIIFINRLIEIIPTTSKTPCQYFSCIVGASNKYLLVARIGFSLINIIFALILAFLIKRVIINSNFASHLNKTVFKLVMYTTLIECIPLIGAQVYVMVTEEQLFQYTGPVSTTAVCLNISLSAALYFKTFKKIGNSSSIQVAVTPINSYNK